MHTLGLLVLPLLLLLLLLVPVLEVAADGPAIKQNAQQARIMQLPEV
jgi:hypothetical protein